jgi:hypothetical protein
MKFIQSNYKLLIGILIGFIISTLPNFMFKLSIGSLLELQLAGYIIALLYFISFTLIEVLIFNNKEILTLQILEVKRNKNMRNISIIMVNNNLLEGKDLFKGIYNTLLTNKEFLNLGFQKIIILSVVLISESEHNLNNEKSFSFKQFKWIQ